MKIYFTTLLIALTTLLSAQVSFEPATSLMDDNAVASTENFFAAETAVIFSNEFNLSFKPGDYYGDIVISYDLNSDSNVRLEVQKVGGAQAVALVNENQTPGAQKVLWDDNIDAGKYTIRLIVGQKVQTKTVNLSY